MVTENLPMGIKIVIPVQYLVEISRWEKFCIPELLFGSIPFYTIWILGRFFLGFKVLAWYTYPNGIENKKKSNTHTLLVLNTVKYPMISKEYNTSSTLVHTTWEPKFSMVC